jgi:threonine/homoserine/homoserine lactone efflux protein
MTDCPAESEPTSSKKCKRGLIFCTVIYALLFPFLLYMGLLSSMVSDSPRITPFFVGVIMFIVFCIPLSIPISIYLMWSRYFRKQYDKARLFSGIPVYVMAIVFILLGIVPYLYHAVRRMFA